MHEVHFIQHGELNLARMKDRPHAYEFESGNWLVAIDTAERLVGGGLYLHPAQQAPSDYGGRILGYRVLADGPDAGKIVFRFIFTPEYRGVLSRDGWGTGEKKYVWDKTLDKPAPEN